MNKNLSKIFEGFKTFGRKITSAAKFIGYFVHDILDYTIINKDEKIFTKALSVFDIRDAINEIVKIQEDKASMKNIRVRTVF